MIRLYEDPSGGLWFSTEGHAIEVNRGGDFLADCRSYGVHWTMQGRADLSHCTLVATYEDGSVRVEKREDGEPKARLRNHRYLRHALVQDWSGA